jgi:LPS-assembly protein
VRVRFIVLTCALAALFAARDAAAQIPGWSQKSFSLERIDAERFRLMREVEIEGETSGPNAGQKFFADDLQLNIKTGELSAIGNVVFSTPTARISADSVVFNTKTNMGTFNNASGIAQLGERGERNRSMFGGALEPDVYFRGATIEKIGPDKYRITKGSFTTCVQPTPRWMIVSGTATLNLDDYVLMRNAVVRVKDVPVFYLPLLYYPIQEDDRATGVLMPMYGSSLAAGPSISNAFFWAINRSHDATFFHDWMFSRGNGLGTEYRYLVGPQAQGNLRYYFLDEKEALINGFTRNARRSKSITGNLSQSLPGGLSARARVDYFTNVTVQQTYNYDFFNATNSARSYGGGLSGAWRQLSANASYQRVETFYNETSSIVNGVTPGINATLSGVQFGALPLFASVTADASRVSYIAKSGTTIQDLGLTKMDATPSLRAALSTLAFLQVNATVSYRHSYYSESLAEDKFTQIEVPVTRSYTDMRVDVIGPVFSRVFNPQNALADRIKHVFEPSFSMSRRSLIPSQDRVPQTSGASDIIIGGTTQLNYGLTNRVMVRKEATGVPALDAPREFLNVSVRQSYYTDPAASRFDPSYGTGPYRARSAFSPIAVNIRALPVAQLAVDYRLEYDPITPPPPLTPPTTPVLAPPKFLSSSLNGTLKSDVADVTAGWSRQSFNTGTRSNNFVQSGANFRFVDGKIGGSVTYNYDVSRLTLINQRYSGFYNAQCCGVSFEYQSFNYPDRPAFLLPQDRRFNISFTLAGVGSFSNLLGAFGGGGMQ